MKLSGSSPSESRSRRFLKMEKGLYKIPRGLVTTSNLWAVSLSPMLSEKQEPILKIESFSLILCGASGIWKGSVNTIAKLEKKETKKP
jgi:hypothetical protein